MSDWVEKHGVKEFRIDQDHVAAYRLHTKELAALFLLRFV